MSNKENYLNYEYYCIDKHSKDFNHITYHWSVIPDTVLIESGYFKSENELRQKRKHNNQILKEYGLDGISIEYINNNNIYHGLQMKLWNNTICANDIGTFMSVIFNRFSNESKGYLYHTSKLEKTLKNDIINGNKIYEIKTKNPFIVYDNNINLNITNKEYILRPYQLEAIEKLNQYWTGIKSLILPCGTGKTTIFCEYLKQNCFDNIFIFSPLTMLTEQNLDNLINYLPSYNHILVDVNGTRDINIINEKLNQKTIYSCTFKSAEEIISKIFNVNNNVKLSNNTILIVDEAHNILNLNNILNLINKFNKVLLVTATPPTQLDDIIPNNTIYRYSFNKAIEDNYICDYKVYLPYIEDNNIIMDQPEELLELDENICKKCLFLLNGLLRTGSRRTIVYLKHKDECDIYKKTLKDVMDKYHYYNVNIDIITSDVSKTERVKILNNFEKDEEIEMIKIILSIRILDEGINIVKCDSIYLTHFGEKINDIRTTQRFLRANRKDDTNPNKIANIFIWCEDINKCLDSFQMLKYNDINFNKKIKIYDNNYGGYYTNNNILSNINKYDTNNNIIEQININCLTEEEIWNNKKEILFNYCNIYNNVPDKKEIYNNVKIGKWYMMQKLKLNETENVIDNIVYVELTKNIHVKNDFDKYFKEKKQITNTENLKTANIITTKYKCKRCDCYQTFLMKDLYRHLSKKHKCTRNKNSYAYSDDQLLLLSLNPHDENEQSILTDEDIKFLENSDIMYSNVDMLIDELNKAHKNKSRKCLYCKEQFTKMSDLRRHIIMKCFINNLNKKNNNNITINGNNNSISNNNDNTINNIYLDSKNIVPFDDKWDTSMLDKKTKYFIVFNEMMYPSFLEEILKNDNNLNVIIDKKSDSGIVYKNKEEDYVKMKLKDIVKETMEKIKTQLLEINNELKPEVFQETNTYQRRMITKKHIDYTKIQDLQENVNQCMVEIFNKKRNDAISILRK